MQKGRALYTGKAKVVYETDMPDRLVLYFRDDATAFNAKKRGVIANKGVINAYITAKIFSYLEDRGIPTHFLERASDRELTVKKVEIVPVEVVVRNRVAGSLAKRMGREEGAPLRKPVREYFFKSDSLDDPMISEDFILADGLATEDEFNTIKEKALIVNELLLEMFQKTGILLVDFKLEFGRADGQILLADEITPDGCRLWDATTLEKLDKDRFRRDLGKVEEAYLEVVNRLFPDFPKEVSL